jgi:hypothetical protein
LGEISCLDCLVPPNDNNFPFVPGFNEVSWTRYPAHQGRITRHRDFREYGGIIAVFTLQGSSIFRVYDSDIDAVEWQTKPGQLVLLRGEGWPFAGKRCPRTRSTPHQTANDAS